MAHFVHRCSWFWVRTIGSVSCFQELGTGQVSLWLVVTFSFFVRHTLSSLDSSLSNSLLDLNSHWCWWSSFTKRSVSRDITTKDVSSGLVIEWPPTSIPYSPRVSTIWTSVTGPISVPARIANVTARILWKLVKLCIDNIKMWFLSIQLFHQVVSGSNFSL